VLRSRGTISKNKTQTISVSTLVKSYYEYKISCYLMTYPRTLASYEWKEGFYLHVYDVNKLRRGYGNVSQGTFQ